MWTAIIIIGTIVGIIVGAMMSYSIYNDWDDVRCYKGAFIVGIILFIVCWGAKLCFDDKVFKCTDVSLLVIRPSEYKNDKKRLYETKVEALGSEMVLEFYDKSVKCTYLYKQKEEKKIKSFVLDEVLDSYNPHIYQTESVKMELNEFLFFVTSFTINGAEGQVLKFKRVYF